MPNENPDQQQQAETPEVQAPSLDELLRKNQANEESIRRLEENNAKLLKEAKNRTEREKQAEAAARRREIEAKPEAEQWEHRIRETETRAERAERERDEEKAGRARDKQDVQILTSISGKMPDGSTINPLFSDYVLYKLDRSMLEVDETGKVVKGLKEAISAVARENPAILVPKAQEKGSGPINRNGGTSVPAPPKRDEKLGDFDFPLNTGF